MTTKQVYHKSFNFNIFLFRNSLFSLDIDLAFIHMTLAFLAMQNMNIFIVCKQVKSWETKGLP
jgi:hypothetical protein